MGKGERGVKIKPSEWTIAKRGLFFLCIMTSVVVLLTSLFCPVVQITGQNISISLVSGDTAVLLPKKAYQAGDCAVFESDEKHIVTYVLGAPGDVVIASKDGKAIVNNIVLNATFQFGSSYDGSAYQYPYTVPDGYYFTVATLVDKKGQGVSAVGLVAKDQMVGKVGACVWPLNHVGLGEHLEEEEA